VRGAALKQDDIVDHFFTTTTHHWILFFTNQGRVYRAKAYQLPESGRDARGQHVANLLAFQPDEQIAQVLDVRDYERAPHLVLATRSGMVKKTRLTEYNSNRTGGVIAINLKEGDELISAVLCASNDDLLLVSRKGQSARFHADDATLRPMARATQGVIGMKFRRGDELLAMDVVRDEAFLVTVTDGGFAKRTSVEEWTPKGRGILGVKAMRLANEERGLLVGALVAIESDEIFAIKASGEVIRTSVDQIRATGRDTMGVTLTTVAEGDAVVAVTRNPEETVAEDVSETPDGKDGVAESSDAEKNGAEARGTDEPTNEGEGG